jgi:hypothetical protein
MTTFTDFVPNSFSPFSFQPTLDGEVYTATIKWNLAGQRWYINLVDSNQTPIFTLPLIGSPTGIALSSLSWDPLNQVVDVETQTPHGYDVEQTIELTLINCAPAVYNGIVPALITGLSTFTYPMSADPGYVTQLGSVEYNINIAGGYFETSTLVFRQQSQQFEVSP